MKTAPSFHLRRASTAALGSIALVLLAIATACATAETDPKEINGRKVIGSHVVNGRKVYELESGKSDEQTMADTLAQMKADTDKMVIPPAPDASPAPQPAASQAPAPVASPTASQSDSGQQPHEVTPSTAR